MVLTPQSRSVACQARQGSYALTAHVEDFEMEGASIAAIPFSMAIEAPDSSALIAQFDELIEGTGKLDTGAEGLEEGTTALAAGTRKLESGTTQLQGGAQELSAGVAAYVAGDRADKRWPCAGGCWIEDFRRTA